MNLLLLSNGTMHGEQFLEYADDWVRDVFPSGGNILFVPFAASDHAAYATEAAAALGRSNLTVISAHTSTEPSTLLDAVDGILIGGGNCFRLLDGLQRGGLLTGIARRVRAGLPYVGASAGTVVACPTISTTNDMPIVWPTTLDAFGFLDFQINAHYVEADPTSSHMGETRDERIREFHQENDMPVLGLREGSALRVAGNSIKLRGKYNAKLFRRQQTPIEVRPNEELSSRFRA